MRIELTLSAWKAEVLPLNYIRKSGAEDEIHYGRGRWIRTIES